MKVFFMAKPNYRKYSLVKDEEEDWDEAYEIDISAQGLMFLEMFEEVMEWQPVH